MSQRSVQLLTQLTLLRLLPIENTVVPALNFLQIARICLVRNETRFVSTPKIHTTSTGKSLSHKMFGKFTMNIVQIGAVKVAHQGASEINDVIIARTT